MIKLCMYNNARESRLFGYKGKISEFPKRRIINYCRSVELCLTGACDAMNSPI
jgi:hypothetical protein